MTGAPPRFYSNFIPTRSNRRKKGAGRKGRAQSFAKSAKSAVFSVSHLHPHASPTQSLPPTRPPDQGPPALCVSCIVDFPFHSLRQPKFQQTPNLNEQMNVSRPLPFCCLPLTRPCRSDYFLVFFSAAPAWQRPKTGLVLKRRDRVPPRFRLRRLQKFRTDVRT